MLVYVVYVLEFVSINFSLDSTIVGSLKGYKGFISLPDSSIVKQNFYSLNYHKNIQYNYNDQIIYNKASNLQI